MNWEWIETKEGDYVGFSFPCLRNYGFRYWSDPCDEGQHTGSPHGHIVLGCEDGGFGRVPACIYSRRFLEVVVITMVERKVICVNEALLILHAPQTQTLQPDMTPWEECLVSEPLLLEDQLQFGWINS